NARPNATIDTLLASLAGGDDDLVAVWAAALCEHGEDAADQAAPKAPRNTAGQDNVLAHSKPTHPPPSRPPKGARGEHHSNYMLPMALQTHSDFARGRKSRARPWRARRGVAAGTVSRKEEAACPQCDPWAGGLNYKEYQYGI